MTASRRLIFTLAIGALSISLAQSLAIAQSAETLPARSNSDGGVQVVVKPKKIAAGSPWEFDVTMSTHTTPLTNDLSKTAVLIDGAGRRYKPISWQGDPPGGHHRKGVLRFPEPATQAKSFEIQIQGVGVSIRVFQWTMR